MLEHFKQIVAAQLEAALAMLRQCIEACPPEHWEGRIANETFCWNAYHALFYTDLYLSASNETFVLRDMHERGGDERSDKACAGLAQHEMLAYVTLVHRKIFEAIAPETEESLAGPSGFPWYKITRAEMYVVNIRHLQHHAAQLSAYLRRVDERNKDPTALRWIRSGWQ